MVFGMSTLRQHIKKRTHLASFILAFPLDDKTDTSILEPFKSKIEVKTHLVPLPQGEKWVEKRVFKICIWGRYFKFGEH